MPGSDLPYVVHLSNVTMGIIIAGFHTENFDTAFAIQVALLHDTIEDTSATTDRRVLLVTWRKKKLYICSALRVHLL
ncbi:hypothetical protein [Flavihumibacter profundi]|uniref:hypothetical protein n=1 Tax=Flavihumibacter profundi TaxID=2716883 RepID=UPI001CC4FC6A|nr:hypothetical protein [Flavihumibacter profundi]MBZ5857607.1 hypothetical protein [Flavihumibacter profundi]